jgi:phytoene/squalene synthetase
VFEAQAGSLRGAGQLSEYCNAVLGNPIRFAARLFQWRSGRGVELGASVEAAARDVGEFLQLANITRDIEKDLLRGVSYHHELSGLAREQATSDSDLIRAARAALCDRALSLASSYLDLVDGMQLKRGLMSASALMMLRFTEQHYRRTAALVGVKGESVSGLKSAIWRSLPAAISGAWARAQMESSVQVLTGLREELPAQASSMYLS